MAGVVVSLTREQLVEAVDDALDGLTPVGVLRDGIPVEQLAPIALDAVLEAVAGYYEQIERSHPASDGPALIYVYEVAQHLRSLLTKGQDQ